MLHKTINIPFCNRIKKTSFFHRFEKICLFFAYLFIFLGTSNFFGLQGIFVLIGALHLVICILLGGKIRLDAYFLCSLLFFFFYIFSDLINSNFSLSTLFYSSLILIIQQFCYSYRDKPTVQLLLAFSFVGGLFVSSIFTIVATIWNQGFVFDEGFLSAFWSNDVTSLISRTGLSLYTIGALSICTAVLLFKNPFRKWFTIPLLIFVIIFSIVTGFIAGNRSMVVSFIILVFVMIGLYCYKAKKYLLLFVYILSILSIAAIIYLILVGVIPLPPSLANITIIRRFIDSNYNSNEIRANLYKTFFENFYKYPFGGMYKLDNFKYVHNIFLDFYVFGGILPFIIFIAFYIFYFVLLFKTLRTSSSIKNIIFFSCMVGITSLGLFEPIYQANQNCLMPIIIFFFFMAYNSNYNAKIGKNNFKKIVI